MECELETLRQQIAEMEAKLQGRSITSSAKPESARNSSEFSSSSKQCAVEKSSSAADKDSSEDEVQSSSGNCRFTFNLTDNNAIDTLYKKNMN